MNMKKTTLRYIIIKLLKKSDKEKILKAAMEKDILQREGENKNDNASGTVELQHL